MLPVSVEDQKKHDSEPQSGRFLHRRAPEISLVFLTSVMYVIATFTHLNCIIRSAIVAITSLSALLVFALPIMNRRLLWLFLVPAAVGGATLGGMHAVWHFVPGFGVKYSVRDSDGPAPRVPLTGEISMSVVIPARNEDELLLINTLKSLFLETPAPLLKEVIIVDDESEDLVLPQVDKAFPETDPNRIKISVIRTTQREGLIRAKMIGAAAATASHILFLDGHCKLGPNYAEHLLARSLAGTYRDIIVPVVIGVDASSFEFTATDGGKKMMFLWNFEFSWFDNGVDDLVPISSGGILLMSRREFQNGAYDFGMLEWGGENIEQSLRAWMCGGRILVERQAKIGHVFNRKLRPGRVNVSAVHVNQARAAFVWLDDYLRFFEHKHTDGNKKLLNMGSGIDERLELRHRLKCEPFESFVTRFETIFDQRSLFADSEHAIQDLRSGLCLTAKELESTGKQRDRKVQLVWDHCLLSDNKQRFGPILDHKRVRAITYERCLDRNGKGELLVLGCDTAIKNANQNWRLSNERVHSNLKDASVFRKADDMCLKSPGEMVGNTTLGMQAGVVTCKKEENVVIARQIYQGY